jgi:hypothetical protein
MTIGDFLHSRGLSREAIEELLPWIPAHGEDGVFCDAARIMDADRWFYWPGQTRFVLVGQCPNGDAVAIDTQEHPGAVYYVAHEFLGGDRAIDDVVIRVAESPSDFVERFIDNSDFPYDFFEARDQSTEPLRRANRRQPPRSV